MSNIRERIVALARLYVGCGVTKQKERYVDLLMHPGDPSSMRAYYANRKTSGCALTIAGFLRLMGYKSDVLHRYAIGMAIVNLGVIASREKASVGPSIPQPGDWVRVGGEADGGGETHVFLVTDVSRVFEGTCTVTVIEGGQRDEYGEEIIQENAHSWSCAYGVWWDRHGATRRKVRDVVDIEKLTFPDPAVRDEDTEPGT